jgi:hypothetical protein
MKTGTNEQSSFFYPALASVAMITPIFLVVIAGILPEGLERGDAFVYSHGLLLTGLAIALVLRAAYSLGFSKAFKFVISKPNRSVIA